MGSRQFLTVPIVQTLLSVTFGYSPSSEAVVMRQLRRWKRLWRRSLTHSHKRTLMGPSRSCWNGKTNALQPEESTSKGTRVSCVYYQYKWPYEESLEIFLMILVYWNKKYFRRKEKCFFTYWRNIHFFPFYKIVVDSKLDLKSWWFTYDSNWLKMHFSWRKNIPYFIWSFDPKSFSRQVKYYRVRNVSKNFKQTQNHRLVNKYKNTDRKINSFSGRFFAQK